MKKIIYGKKIILRLITLSDVNNDYLSWLNDSEVNSFLETRHKIQTLDSISDYVLQNIQNTKVHMFAICIADSLIHIGNIKIGPINTIHKTSYISYFIGNKNFWGKGLATEALYLTTKYAFMKLKLSKCNAGVYDNNIASKKVLNKVGYTKEGCIRSAFNFTEKTRIDHILYGIKPEELIIHE